MATDFDGAWKFAVEYLLSPMLELLAPDLWQAVDWTVPPVFLDKELPRITGLERRGRRFVDKLVRLQLKDRSQWLLLLHIEVQDRTDPDFDYRMYCYYHWLEQLYRQKYRITSLAILSDLNANWRPTAYTSGAFGTRLQFDFPIVKLLDLEPQLEALIEIGHPFAMVAAAHLAAARTKRRAADRSRWKHYYMKQTLDRHRSLEEAEIVLNFVDWVMTLPSELDMELKAHLNSRLKEANMTYFGGIFGPIRKQAYLEGSQEGQLDGKKESLLELIIAKFGEVPDSIRSRIAAAPLESVSRWTLNVLRAEKLDQILS